MKFYTFLIFFSYVYFVRCPLPFKMPAKKDSRSYINTRFELFTATTPREGYILDAEDEKSLLSSPLNPNTTTRFIVHGFIDNRYYTSWQDNLKDELLLGNKGNVILVDWRCGNIYSYFRAATNTRVVGAEIAYLIMKLEKTVGLKRSDVHIIGHSLGAHAAGYAGERLPGLGRITGLDPAEFLFQYLPPSVRLDETDALFVDVIHTDTEDILFLKGILFSLGMKQPIGHVDFYPNDGKRQPGCSRNLIKTINFKGLSDTIRYLVSCSHQRAIDIFHHSINHNSCVHVGYECPSWTLFEEGKCSNCGPDGSKCGIMGFRADEGRPFNRTNVKLYIKTSGHEPFCLQNYQISFKLQRKKEIKTLKGKIEITLHGQFQDVTGELTKKYIKLYPGSRYFYKFSTDKNIGPITSVGFQLKTLLRWFTRKTFLEYVEVMPMNVINNEKRYSETKKFCLPNPLKPIYSNQWAVLTNLC